LDRYLSSVSFIKNKATYTHLRRDILIWNNAETWCEVHTAFIFHKNSIKLKMSENAPPSEEQAPSIQKIQELLAAKDDTSRFVGLALLKSVLDNTPELRNDEEAIVSLWESIPAKFLDRLIKTGSKQKSADTRRKASNDMLDLAVSVLHTFAALLPETAKKSPKLVDRIPQLVACLLQW
jgi:hypothetical protein